MIGHTEPNKDDDLWAGWYVLILVLMEDTLGVKNSKSAKTIKREGLNPCFNGRYPRSVRVSPSVDKAIVLILVLMEDTLGEVSVSLSLDKPVRLNPCFNGRYPRRHPEALSVLLSGVLILVLMEDTLGDREDFLAYLESKSLNPCFNGRFPRRGYNKNRRGLSNEGS